MQNIDIGKLVKLPDGGWMNSETGEVLPPGQVTYFENKKKVKFEGSFSFMGNQMLGKKIREAKLTGFEYDIFFILVENMDFGGVIELTQSEIAKISGIDKSQISKAFKKLSDKGIIYHKRSIGKKTKIYALNPQLIYMGGAQDHQKAINEHRTILAKRAEEAKILPMKRKSA